MALTKAQLTAACVSVTVLLAGGGYALSNSSNDGTPTPAPAADVSATTTTDAPTSATTAVNSYAELADRAVNSGATFATEAFQNCTPLFKVMADLSSHSYQQAQNATHQCMDTTKTETFNVAQTTLAQYGPKGHLSGIDAQTAQDLHQIGQTACAPMAEPLESYSSEYEGQSITAMVEGFTNDVMACLNTVNALASVDQYNKAGTSVSVSAEFQSAAFPMNQDWASIIALHNDYMDWAITKDDAAGQRFKMGIAKQ